MKIICCVLVMLLLTGCAGQQVFEQLEDVYASQAAPEPKKIGLSLPKDASSQVLAGSNGVLYFCEGYEISTETMAAGNLGQTILSLTGFQRDDLTLMETKQDGAVRYECVWSSVNGEGQQVNRAVILDDGNYHYCVWVCADAQDAGALRDTWQALLSSIVLS